MNSTGTNIAIALGVAVAAYLVYSHFQQQSAQAPIAPAPSTGSGGSALLAGLFGKAVDYFTAPPKDTRQPQDPYGDYDLAPPSDARWLAQDSAPFAGGGDGRVDIYVSALR